jgi:hypothetical protein
MNTAQGRLAQPAAAAAARAQPVGQPHLAGEGRPGWKLSRDGRERVLPTADQQSAQDHRCRVVELGQIGAWVIGVNDDVCRCAGDQPG